PVRRRPCRRPDRRVPGRGPSPGGETADVLMAVALDTARQARIEALGYDYAAQPKDTLAHCNLCGGQRFVVLAHYDRYRYPAEAHACARCGLVFLNPRMTAGAYARFYDGIYRPLVSAFHGRLIDARTIQDEQRAYAAER